MNTIIKLFRDKNPYGSGLVWCLRWSDGKEEYTIDAASGVRGFRLKDELRMRRYYLSESLLTKHPEIRVLLLQC